MTEYEYLPFSGWRLTKDGQQITINNIAIFKEGLTNEQLVTIGAALKDYLLSLEEEKAGLPELSEEELDRRFEDWKTRSRIMDVPQSYDTGAVYKYMSDIALSHWLAGRAQISPVSVYRQMENAFARDEQEGLGAFYLHDGRTAAYFAAGAGVNCGVMCFTGASPSENRAEMKGKFGERIVRFPDTYALLQVIARHLDVVDFELKDVQYSDVKVYSHETAIASEIADLIIGKDDGSLDPKGLVTLFDKHSEELLKLAELPSVFCKPKSFEGEAERRAVFRFRHSVNSSIVVTDKRISELIEVIE
ncbi:hypothetical protein Rleg9DRAFT_6540 [Rhizobium leguminosarum bv. trifolii WSM597]|uniref:Uncharacterized protein n=1 Tax=Rhizobium leguminosarum bv. trifolii WSM597 TaxID=754764 RepID=J0HAU6_RHILT|nr:hypothetical protein [Rhizobium leguminosarum]EJB07525.1 hypothetical protein Rleg9DRAFT_6540 [Rhizobium leguminosarum bv. trifolii WSM597]